MDLIEARITSFGKFVARASSDAPGKKNGIKYEQKFHDEMLRSVPSEISYLINPQISARDADGIWKRMIPDAILLSADLKRVLVCEVKLRNNRDAREQLEKYEKAAATLWPRAEISTLEICKTFEPVWDPGAIIFRTLVFERIGLWPEVRKAWIENVKGEAIEWLAR